MRLTIIPEDNVVVKDQSGRGFDLASYSIPSNVHALQWYDNNTGEIEYNDGTPEDSITELPSWATSCLSRYEGIIAEENAPPTLEQIEQGELMTRAALLLETDHWANADTPDMTQEEMDYRQALRDITSAEGWPTDHVWPTKPSRSVALLV